MNFFLLLTSVLSQNPTNDDFVVLKKSILNYISENPEIAPPLVRIAFHDLFNFDSKKGVGRPHGCLFFPNVQNFTDNVAVSGDTLALRDWVLKDIPNPTFSMGDLLSFAGKIAMEETAPCLKLKWRYGRGNCDDPLSEISNAPNGTIDTLEKYTPFLDRYNFTAKEMAILTAGTHGIATAAAAPENSGFGPFDFTLTNSGQDWIKNTIEGEWEESLSEKNQKQYTARFGASTFMRLPSDFVFFPKKLQSFSASVFDLKLNDVQEYLVSFLGKERGAFDNEFKVVYEKMLEIGVDPTKMTVFEEPLDVLECTDEYYPPLLALSGFTTKNVIALSCCILSMVLGFFGLVYVTK